MASQNTTPCEACRLEGWARNCDGGLPCNMCKADPFTCMYNTGRWQGSLVQGRLIEQLQRLRPDCPRHYAPPPGLSRQVRTVSERHLPSLQLHGTATPLHARRRPTSMAIRVGPANASLYLRGEPACGYCGNRADTRWNAYHRRYFCSDCRAML